MNKKILYFDMDGVIVDYPAEHPDKHTPEFFVNLPAIEGAVDCVKRLQLFFDVYFLSTAPWSNPHAWSGKRLWIEKHFGEAGFKRLILSHNKGLLRGDYLVDDRTANGVLDFQGEHIHLGTEKFPNLDAVERYLIWFSQENKPIN